MRRLLLGAFLIMAGCAGSSEPAPDALAVVKDTEEHVNVRTAALERAWAESRSGQVDPVGVRKEIKDLLWDPLAPLLLRVAAYRALMSDESPEGLADLRRFTSLRLPTEPDLAVIVDMSTTAAQHGWTDLTSSLVRSYSRPDAAIADVNRPEHKALRSLHPETPVTRVAFDVFADPIVVDGDGAADRRERARTDAWELLSRLDPDGRERMRWIDEAGDNPNTRVITWCAQELHTIPVTGDELRWLEQLVKTRPGGWWEQTSAALLEAPSGELDGLRLRHLEPIRWAAQHRSERLGQSREQLLAELHERLTGRRHYRRSSMDSTDGPTRDRLSEWEGRLTWADLLTLLVMDDAMQDPGVIHTLFAQAYMDTEDRTTEYGGAVEAKDDGFVARFYSPRPASRRGDFQFVASPDMIDQSAFSLAHYHFHAQKLRNGEYAGPSPGDLIYANQHGRTCLVLTSIEDGVLSVDVLQPGGVAIDIGEIRR